MDYRLVRIYDKTDNGDYRLRIEVCNETHRKSLPPFQRRITLDELCDDYGCEPIISLINQSDAGEQSPFVIANSNYLSIPSIQHVIESLKWSYTQASRHTSIKRGAISIKKDFVSGVREKGQIIAAELYIDNIKSWHRNIRVMFRYENANSTFFPFSNIQEYVKNDGSVCLRDFDKEKSYLHILSPYYNAAAGRLTLDIQDCSKILSEIVGKGWTLYVTKPNRTHARVYVHTTESCIQWFSTSESVDNDLSSMLLESFLKSRNYIESDGNISLINSQEVLLSDVKDVVSITGATKDILSLYDDSECPTAELQEKLQSRVSVTLRPYQVEGVEWLWKKRKAKAGCLLADEMGLGKTLQVISHLACLDNAGHHLIIAPTSLLFNWKNEVEKFAPQLLSSLTIVSYDAIRIHLEDYMDELYDTIVIDEAQMIKNRETKKYKAISQLYSRHKIILTGTPIENSIEDMWSHFLMLNPDFKIVHDNIVNVCGQKNSDTIVDLTAKILKPFILRRTKAEKLKDLPERTEETVYIELSPKERTIYENINKTILEAFRDGVSGRVTSIALEGLLRLRQACVSANILPSTISKSGKFTSTKLSTALGFVNEIKTEGHKVLVFSQFVSALEEMEAVLQSNEINFMTLYGSTRDRDTRVRMFQDDSHVTAFLISLKAGGVGLNLTSADRVILLDDWWNPAVEDQAMGRAHRIGQQNNVHVIRLVCRDTVEEKLLLLQRKKQYTFDLFSKTKGVLTIEELQELLGNESNAL